MQSYAAAKSPVIVMWMIAFLISAFGSSVAFLSATRTLQRVQHQNLLRPLVFAPPPPPLDPAASTAPPAIARNHHPTPESKSLMGRKRKRPRKVEPPAEREPADGEVDGDGEDFVKTNPPMAGPSGAEKREEVSEVEAELENEDIGELLEPFTRDELLDLLTDACLRDPALLARVAASDDAVHRRLFVHGLGPGATSAALAAAFAPFGAFDGCHAVADRATGRCRGYGFVTFRRRSAARRALADSSNRVDGRSVACQLAALGPVARSSLSDRKLFVGNVPERAAHDDLREFFSKFGEIEEGPLGADRATGLFRGYAIFLYKTPVGLRKALEEPTKVFHGCELQCRRAYKVSNRKHAAAAPADTGVQSNGGADAAVLSSVQAKDLALTSKPSLLQSNQPVGLKVKGSSSATAAAATLFRQNAPAGGAGILGAAPVATAVPSSLVHGTSSTPPSGYVSAIGHVGLNDTARVGSNNSASPLQVQGLGTAKNIMPPSLHPGQLSTRPGLIQHYLGGWEDR